MWIEILILHGLMRGSSPGTQNIHITAEIIKETEQNKPLSVCQSIINIFRLFVFYYNTSESNITQLLLFFCFCALIGCWQTLMSSPAVYKSPTDSPEHI